MRLCSQSSDLRSALTGESRSTGDGWLLRQTHAAEIGSRSPEPASSHGGAIAEAATPCRSESDQEAGFALVDSLTALSILAVTCSLAVAVLHTSSQLARRAMSTELASQQLLYALKAQGGSEPMEIGRRPRREREVTLAEDDSASILAGAPICRRSITSESGEGGRQYSAQTLGPCPPARP